AIFSVMAGLGVQLRGPRLVALCMMMFLGLTHVRGLLMLFLITPIILARPLSARAGWFRPRQLVQGLSPETDKALDPVLSYLQKRTITMPAIFLILATIVTAHLWHEINIGPPQSLSPKSAIDFVRTTGIKGNVFNSHAFGGYLIFEGIPTFI